MPPTATAERTTIERVRTELHPILRAEESASPLGVLSGHAAVFDVWTEIRSWYEAYRLGIDADAFIERIGSSAFNKTLSESSDKVRCLFRHGWDPQIGDKVLGKFDQLRADATGLYYEVPLYDTAYNRDLAPGLADQQYGASFRAMVVNWDVNADPGASSHNPKGLPEVTYTELALKELGPCTFGQYPEASSTLRSEVVEQISADPDLRAQFLARIQDPRTPSTTALAAGDGAASPDTEPARHSDVTTNNHDATLLRLRRHIGATS